MGSGKRTLVLKPRQGEREMKRGSDMVAEGFSYNGDTVIWGQAIFLRRYPIYPLSIAAEFGDDINVLGSTSQGLRDMAGSTLSSF